MESQNWALNSIAADFVNHGSGVRIPEAAFPFLCFARHSLEDSVEGLGRGTSERRERRSIGQSARLADDQPELCGARQDLHLRMRIEFAAEIAKVTADGHVADAHPGGNMAIVEPGREQAQHFALAPGEQIEQLSGLAGTQRAWPPGGPRGSASRCRFAATGAILGWRARRTERR